MNDRISGDNHAIVLAGMCTALVVVLSLLGFYMPLLSTVVFLLIPLPIAYLGMKEGVKWSIVVTTGVLVLDSTFFGVVSAAFVCAIFGLLGVTMGICYRFKVSAAKTLIAGAVVVLLALVAEGIATLYLLGLPSLIFGSAGKMMFAPVSQSYEQQNKEQYDFHFHVIFLSFQMSCHKAL